MNASARLANATPAAETIPTRLKTSFRHPLAPAAEIVFRLLTRRPHRLPVGRRMSAIGDGFVASPAISSVTSPAANHGPLSASTSGVSVRRNGLGVDASASIAGDGAGVSRLGARMVPGASVALGAGSGSGAGATVPNSVLRDTGATSGAGAMVPNRVLRDTGAASGAGAIAPGTGVARDTGAASAAGGAEGAGAAPGAEMKGCSASPSSATHGNRGFGSRLSARRTSASTLPGTSARRALGGTGLPATIASKSSSMLSPL